MGRFLMTAAVVVLVSACGATTPRTTLAQIDERVSVTSGTSYTTSPRTALTQIDERATAVAVAGVIDEIPGSYDLFFGAFMISDSLFYSDREGSACFATELVHEMNLMGPAETVLALESWAMTSGTSAADRENLVEVLNATTYDERLAIGRAAETAVEMCGGLRERLIAGRRGPSYSTCYLDHAERKDAVPHWVAASIEMNWNAGAEFGPESEEYFESALMEEDAELRACVENIEAARDAYTATTTTVADPMATCVDAPGRYSYIRVDQTWYMSAKGVNDLEGISYHARVWGERETWLTGEAVGRNHQVTHGPGFDSIATADAWMQLGAREPEEMQMFTFDVTLAASDLGVLDLECLATIEPKEARRYLDDRYASDAERAFDAVVSTLTHNGGLSPEATRFAYEYLKSLHGVTLDGVGVDALGRSGGRLTFPVDTPSGQALKVVLLDPSTYELLEYTEEQHSQPTWTDREVPFASQRETVAARGIVDDTDRRPPGVEPVVDPVRPRSAGTSPAIFEAEGGLSCTGLADLGFSYSESVVYWAIHGQPDHLDPDGNHMPCEDEFDRFSVDAFWTERQQVRVEPSSTTTSTQPLRFRYSPIDLPSVIPDPLPGSGGLLGSGCSPGSDILPDGIWGGWIVEREDQSLTFDLACVGEDPDGVGIVNSSSRLRTVDIYRQAEVSPIDNEGGLGTTMTYRQWGSMSQSDFCKSVLITPSMPPGCPAWIYVNGGSVTAIVEFWIP
jgi:hypothetical protein